MHNKQPYQTTPEPVNNIIYAIITFKYMCQELACKLYERKEIHYPN